MSIHDPVRIRSTRSASRSVISRRRFLGGTLAASAAVSTPAVLRGLAQETPRPTPPEFKRKIKLGIIGCGGRGSWIAKLFQAHGGYEIHAVADYFPEVADKCGDAVGVDSSRRFSTLSGYKRVLAGGVEAVALETPPYFFPEHATAAVEAGLHVYLAKPVAVDVPGCQAIEAAAKSASARKRVFFVDYQLPTDPANQEVVRHLRDPAFGKIARVSTTGLCGYFRDPPLTDSIESRLQKLIWVNDIALGGDYIGNYDIHAIDAALWALGQRPVAAMGASRVCRPDPHGDSHDVCLLTFEYADGVIHDHDGQALKNFCGDELSCRIYGQTGNALLSYWNKVHFRSAEDGYTGEVANLYEDGVIRNIAAFYQLITEENHRNNTVPRAVDGALTCVLGRVAAERRRRVTMEEVLKENVRLEVSLRGLKT